ncbi:hypothetical protein F6673_24895, partial [Salmonella enterica]|nr:hypothetical protein [Salmonella enterica]
ETITVTTTPAADIGGLQDFIYWRPDAAGTGVEPIYVILSSPYYDQVIYLIPMGF